jgi:hypothetical protein
MSFLFYFLTTLSFITSRVEWLSTKLEIKLNENIEDYLSVPHAELYLDNVLTEDPNVFYERNGVERTFTSTINTSIVKTYQVKFKVTFPTYKISSIQTITFSIIDDVPPVILKMPFFKVALTQNIPDLSAGLQYSDNYDSQSKLILNIDSSQIVKTKIGVYPIIYKVTDTSNNQTTGVSYLEIFDPIPPDITLKKPFMITVGTYINYQDFLTIKDNYDLVVRVTIDDHLVNYSKLGTYLINVKATDQSGNVTSINFELTIIDNIAPHIKLKASPKPIPVHQEITHEFLLSYVLFVSDNYDQLTTDDITIYHDIDTDRIGTYTIFYTIYDLSHNMKEVKLIIKVIDDIAPIIDILEPFIFDVYSSLPHFIDFIDVHDNYDTILKSSIKIQTLPKMNIVGVYPITIEVKDLSGNSAYYRDYIHIVDRIPPQINQLSDIIIIDFTQRSFLSYFDFSDQYDDSKNLVITIDDSKVIYHQIGNYPIDVEVSDSSHNKTTYESHVIVIDLIEPILTLTHHYITKDMDSPDLILIDFIKDAYDNYDVLTHDDVLIEHTIKYEKIGIYLITYTLIDKSLNQSVQRLTLKIDDTLPPIITGLPISIKTNQIFDPYEGITVTDNTSHVSIKSYPEIIDTSFPGTHVITYVATDQRGNQTTFKRLLTIIKDDTSPSIDQYVPLLIITLISLSSIYYFWKKM